MLTYSHTLVTVFHMKTTLNIDDTVMNRLRAEAAHRGCTMSSLVEAALRTLLDQQPEEDQLAELPTFSCGGPLVDISDRDALYQAMEGR